MECIAVSNDDRKIGIPPDLFRDDSIVFPLSDELPAGAWHVTPLLRELHAHDRWFREQVQTTLTKIEQGEGRWFTQAEADTRWANKRAELETRTKSHS